MASMGLVLADEQQMQVSARDNSSTLLFESILRSVPCVSRYRFR